MEDDKITEIIYDAFSLDVTNYKTRLTKKFINRKPWVPHDPKIIRAFIPGTVTSIIVKKGSKVRVGDVLATFEAMKMKNNIVSSIDSVVLNINVKPGDLVTKETVIIELK